MFSVSSSLSKAYNEQYTPELSAWREIGGKPKAENIMAVCRNHRISKVLECGAGEGSILKWLDLAAVFEHLYAIEISNSGVSRINERGLKSLIEAKRFDGYRIPYADQAFDLAICSHVLEHVEHPRLLLRELARVSRFQVLEVPLDYSPDVHRRAQHLLDYGHINVFTPSLFRFLLCTEGFTIIEERLTHLSVDVLRFIECRGSSLKAGAARELYWRTASLRRNFKKMLLGRRRFDEFGYSAFTCLTRYCGPASVMGASIDKK